MGLLVLIHCEKLVKLMFFNAIPFLKRALVYKPFLYHLTTLRIKNYNLFHKEDSTTTNKCIQALLWLYLLYHHHMNDAINILGIRLCFSKGSQTKQQSSYYLHLFMFTFEQSVSSYFSMNIQYKTFFSTCSTTQ